MKLVEIEPGRFVIERQRTPPTRSDLPCPYIISDIMEPVEQVDGQFYTSKRKFRAVGRALGLIEVGNEKFKPKVRSTDLPETKRARRTTLKTALEKYKAGHRIRRDP
jgi:hypothetical protein